MNATESQVVEQIVVMFPSLAAWLIVLLVGTIAAGGALAVRKFIARLDTIEGLLASEIKSLREMHHGIEVRVARLEEHRRLGDYGRRWDDPNHNGGSDD
jgi:hypothetical protein